MEKTDKLDSIRDVFTQHAIDMFTLRARILGLSDRLEHLERAYLLSKRERVSRDKVRNWNLFARRIKNHTGEYRVFQGWRFIIKDRKVITVERIKTSENLTVKHLQTRFFPAALTPASC